MQHRAGLLVVFALLFFCELAAAAGTSVCNFTASDHKEKRSWFYDLESLWHETEMADSLYCRDPQGNIVYVNVCGVTTTHCNPVQAVCSRSTQYVLTGFGSLSTQRFQAISAAYYFFN